MLLGQSVDIFHRAKQGCSKFCAVAILMMKWMVDEDESEKI